jgi:hypothetical protein
MNQIKTMLEIQRNILKRTESTDTKLQKNKAGNKKVEKINVKFIPFSIAQFLFNRTQSSSVILLIICLLKPLETLNPESKSL